MKPSETALYGVIIPDEVACEVLNVSEDILRRAKDAGQIETIEVGSRRKILGVPFRRKLGLPERAPQHESVAA
ncbi:hypothetical protein [Methylobacterium sp. GC_Met_2]|uniref:hypothetical protein n=1 Tax=Methylobacterium sp. GC_Met_2 TaxID=2937376 RepID=UPI00226B10C7|nr:hypothetical protein [Methylobacterium sp. GC_Met_2]